MISVHRAARPLVILLFAVAFLLYDATAPARLSVAVAAGDPLLLAAGDIASCSSTGDEATAAILTTLPEATVVTLGDNVYDNGTAAEFTGCYDTSWGAAKARTQPSPGNHDYNTPGATGYYGYFGAAAGDPAKGYYSFDIGAWHLIAINSSCTDIGGCAAGSPQEQWLRADLRAHPAACTLAYWHHPRFSSGPHGNHAVMQSIWQALYDYGADVVLSGHDHDYERFAPQTPAGAADPTHGIREFIVGTGGRSHYATGTPAANSAVRNSDTYGVLKVTLHAAGYDWEFLPEAEMTFTDSGAGACHGSALDPDADAFLDAEDNCPTVANNAQTDADADALGDACEQSVYGTDAAVRDTEGDGCADGREVRTATFTRQQGGDRDPLSPWDLYDVPAPAGPATGADGKLILTPASAQNLAVNLQDVSTVLAYVGRASSNAAYAADNNADGAPDGPQLDRTPSTTPGKPWRSGPPSGAVTLQDVSVALPQVGDSCAGAP